MPSGNTAVTPPGQWGVAGLGGGLSQLEGPANEQLALAFRLTARLRLVLASQELTEVRLVQQVSV